MSVVAFIKRLREKGWSWDQAMEAAEAFEAEAPPMGRELTARQARNRRYYENKRLKASEITPLKTESDAGRLNSDGLAPSCAQVVNPTSSLRSEDITPHQKPSVSSPRKAKPARSRLVPDGWTPPPKVLADLTDQGFMPGEIERELANFRDHEFRDPKTAWDLAFRKWMRNSRNFQPRQAHERPHHDAKFAARQANHAAAFEGAQRAAGRDREP
jgi:hypothetical protein